MLPRNPLFQHPKLPSPASSFPGISKRALNSLHKIIWSAPTLELRNIEGKKKSYHIKSNVSVFSEHHQGVKAIWPLLRLWNIVCAMLSIFASHSSPFFHYFNFMEIHIPLQQEIYSKEYRCKKITSLYGISSGRKEENRIANGEISLNRNWWNPE